MRRFALALLALSACLHDDPERSPFGEGQDNAGDEEAGSSSEGGDSEGAGAEATGEPLAGLYGECDLEADCAPPETGDVVCVARTCVWWNEWVPVGSDVSNPESVCPTLPDAAPIVRSAEQDAVCALAAEVDEDGLGHCPDAMVLAVLDGVATCWHGEVLGGDSCNDDEDCDDEGHCMGQPAGAQGYLPNVCA